MAVNKLAGTARTPLIGAAPTAPTPRAVLLALAGWLRREYEYSVLGRRPVITPSQLAATATGPRVVLGTMNASGPNADLSYEVTEQPLRGIVTVDASGLWTYKAVDGFPSDGGADEFTVKVTDKAFHLANLFGAPAYTRTVTVPVSVPDLIGAPNGPLVFTISNLNKLPLFVRYMDDPRGVTHPFEGTLIKPGQVVEFRVTDLSQFPENGLAIDFTAGQSRLLLYTVLLEAVLFGDGVYPFVSCIAASIGKCNSGAVSQVVLSGR